MSATAHHAPWKGRALGGVGILGHCTIVAFFYYVSPLIAPPYAVHSLWVVWGAFLILAVYVFTKRPAWTLVIPVLAVAVWFGVMALGDWLLGWTA